MNKKLTVPGFAQNKLPPGGKPAEKPLPVAKKAGKK